MPKKKSSSSNELTKGYLDKALSDGFINFRGVFREELDTTITFRLKMQKDEILREVKEIVTKNNSTIFTRIDPLLSRAGRYKARP